MAPVHTEYLPGGEEMLRQAELPLDRVFDDPRIRVWRDLPERQNCTLDTPAGRLHIKRYKPPHGSDASREAAAIRLLTDASIPTVPLVAWGQTAQGGGFLISQDLAGFIPADKLLAERPDTVLLNRIAAVAHQLHAAGLRHRDLYLCHFFIHRTDRSAPIHLIDPGRVSRLPIAPLHLRWIVKDVAQLHYSFSDAQLPTDFRNQVFEAYLRAAHPATRGVLRCLVPMKVRLIARHDRKLRAAQPGRRISLDSQP